MEGAIVGSFGNSGEAFIPCAVDNGEMSLVNIGYGLAMFGFFRGAGPCRGHGRCSNMVTADKVSSVVVALGLKTARRKGARFAEAIDGRICRGKKVPGGK